MKKNLVYFLFFSFGAVVFWACNAYFLIDSAPFPVAAKDLGSCPEKIGVAQLENENRELKDQVAHLNALLKNKENSSGTEKSVTEKMISADQNHSDLARLYGQVTSMDSLNAYLNRIRDQNLSLHKELENSFSTEAVDYEWAHDYEQKIRLLIEQNAPFGDAGYVSVLCKTHRCQIKAIVGNSDEANGFVEAFAGLVNKNDLGVNPVPVLSAVDSAHSELNLYITKDIHFKAYE
ncbi:hypothetical protein [Cellvibrio fontiphilus]|uniref:Uncharacterized protein n=1 Tax=Cellvibrio fontiphilus TaxID=1815559 RepID=A0ABV7FH43_9GAMM